MRFIISLFLVFVCAQAFAGYDGPTVYDPTVNASVNSPIPLDGQGTIGPVRISPLGNTVQLGDMLPVGGPSGASGPQTCSSSCVFTTILGPVDVTGAGTLIIQTLVIPSDVTINLQGSQDLVCGLASNWVNLLPIYQDLPGSTSNGNGSFIVSNLNFVGGFSANTTQWHCMRLEVNAWSSGNITIQGWLRGNQSPEVMVHGSVGTFPVPGLGILTTNSLTGTTGALSVALAAQPSKYNWVCSIDITSYGTTTPIGATVTLTGLASQASGALNFTFRATSAGQELTRTWSPCLESSAQNTAITLTCPALGAGTSSYSCNITGYYE